MFAPASISKGVWGEFRRLRYAAVGLGGRNAFPRAIDRRVRCHSAAKAPRPQSGRASQRPGAEGLAALRARRGANSAHHRPSTDAYRVRVDEPVKSQRLVQIACLPKKQRSRLLLGAACHVYRQFVGHLRSPVAGRSHQRHGAPSTGLCGGPVHGVRPIIRFHSGVEASRSAFWRGEGRVAKPFNCGEHYA